MIAAIAPRALREEDKVSYSVVANFLDSEVGHSSVVLAGDPRSRGQVAELCLSSRLARALGPPPRGMAAVVRHSARGRGTSSSRRDVPGSFSEPRSGTSGCLLQSAPVQHQKTHQTPDPKPGRPDLPLDVWLTPPELDDAAARAPGTCRRILAGPGTGPSGPAVPGRPSGRACCKVTQTPRLTCTTNRESAASQPVRSIFANL